MKKYIFIGLVFLVKISFIFGQENQFNVIKINGKVTDISGTPLVGANVLVLDTEYGASSSLTGEYLISIPAQVLGQNSAIMLASYMGYKSKRDTIIISNESEIRKDLILSPDVLGLETVVVTGLGGDMERKKLGVLIESIRPEAAKKSGETNIVTALRGSVPGLEIRKTSGDAGTNAYFRIRGTGTISGGHEPLIVVDGSPINSSTRTVGGDEGVQSPRNRSEASSRTSDLNIDDIESIEVLKGAAASAIYGSRASNGVILITTKSGKTGKTQITYKTQFGISSVNKNYPLQQRFGQGAGGNYLESSTFSWGPPLNVKGAPWYNSTIKQDSVYDHLSSISDVGYSQEQNIIASGGTERTTFYLSFGRTYEKSHWINYSKYKDIVPTTFGHKPTREVPSDYTRYSIRLKGSHLLRKDLTINSSISYVRVKTNNIARSHTTDGLGRGLLSTPPDFNLLPYLSPSSLYHRSSTNENPTSPLGPHSWNNPYWVLFEMKQGQELNRAFGNIKFDYKPTKWTTISYNLGADYSYDKRLDLLPIGTYRNGGEGRMFRNLNNSLEWDTNLILRVDGESLFGVPANLTMGHNLNSRSSNTIKNLANEQIVINYYQPENYNSQTITEYVSLMNTESVFGQLTYDLFDQLYITAALRRDGSSTFGPSDRQHMFRKFSAAWDFTKRFRIPYLSFGKIRSAFGEAGEQPEVYSIYSGYLSDNIGYFGSKVNLGQSGVYNGVLGYVSDSRLGNSAIRPERRIEQEFGLDLEFLNNRLGIALTGYNAKSSDVIFTMDMAPSTGSDRYTANGAVIRNKGLEMTVNGKIIEKKGLIWTSRFIYAHNNNLLMEMNGVTSVDVKNMDQSLIPIDQLSKFTFTAPGREIGEFRGYSWARFGHSIIATDTDEAGNPIYVDIDSVYAGQWNRNDVYIRRNGMPDVGWRNSDGSSGGYLWSGYSPNPDWTGSFYNELKISNNVRISALVDISSGGQIVNYTKNKLNEVGTHIETEDRYHSSFDDERWYGYEEGVSTGWGRGKMSNFLSNGHAAIGPGADEVIKYDETFYTTIMGTAKDIINNIEDASYVKLREISISYRFDGKKLKNLGIQNLDLRLSARDLYTWSKYSGWDPETNMMQNRISGEDYFNQPQTRGANITATIQW